MNWISLPPDDWGRQGALCRLSLFPGSIAPHLHRYGSVSIKIRIPRNILPWTFLLGLLQTALQYFSFYNGLAYSTGHQGVDYRRDRKSVCSYPFPHVLARTIP